MKNIEDSFLNPSSNPEVFWRDFLRGFTAPVTLPALTSSSSCQCRQAQEIRLSSSQTTNLINFAQNHELSLYTILQAAVALLLSHYTGETDILFGATTEVGDFNVLPLRVLVEPNASVLSWLQTIQIQWSTLNNYEYIALEQIRQWSEIYPELPLLETVIIFNQDVNTEPDEQTKYPLLLSFQAESEILIKIDYEQNKFTDDAITRMLGHIETLLINIINLPEQNLANISLLTETERHLLLVEWNQTQRGYPQHKCIHQIFEEQVEKTPDAIAVVFTQQQLTYRELNQRANQLANYLQTLGVKPEVLVGICTERSLDMIVGILGILKAGGAYVPLDIAYPQERLAFMLSDSQVSILLTQQHLVAKLPEHQTRIVCLDTDWEHIIKTPIQQTEIIVKPENLAYIIYTSGSTGKPKGVLIPHANVIRLFAATQTWFQFNNNDIWSLFHSYAFDFSVWEIWGALLYGGRLVIIPYDVSRSPELFYNLLIAEKITVLNQTPSAFQQLIQLEASLNNHSNLSLRWVIFGGESLDIQSLKPWVERHGDKFPQLVNMYGITETTVHVTYRPINIDDLNSASKVIGCAIYDLQLYILNSHLQPVPIGVAGEIYVGGAGLARGYLNRPELTEQRFIAHPFSDELEARLYKTGDLARYLPNGDIEYLGRIDNQVKIRGFRIELGEIEALLNQHPNLTAAKVITREDIPGDKRLVAYIIPKSANEGTLNKEQEKEHQEFTLLQSEISHQIREYLKQQLPDYMIPAAFVVLDSFPLTNNGKIDYRAFPVPDFSIYRSNYVAPETATEEILAQIWSQVLKVENIGIDDNFFELGGHSLLATQVISRIRQTFQQEIPISLLFQFPTIAQISQHIGITKPTDNSLLISPIEPRQQRENLPLSFAQQRLWFLDQLEPNSTAYNLVYSWEIQGALNIHALEQSIAEIIQRHEVLHTNFVAVDGQPTQIIHQHEFNLSIIDLQSLSDEQRAIETVKIAKQAAETPFNLAEDFLFRVKLLQLSAEKYLLLFNIHHIIFDGWSFGVLFEELQALYPAYCAGIISPLLPLLIQYADFTLWQRKWLNGAVLEAQLNYWKQQLGGNLPILELPTDRPRPRVQTYAGATKSFVLSSELTANITFLAQQEGVTLFMTLLTAFKVLLCRYSRQEDVIVGTPIAGRNRREIEGLMGFFVNTLALRTDLSDHPSFRELLSRVRQVCLEAYTNQDVPFEQLVEVLQPERNLSHTPIFQVMFALQNAPMGELQLPNLSVKGLEPLVQTAKFDLTVSMEERNGKLIGEWEYNTDLFDAATIERMMENFQILLSGILTNPEQSIWQLPLLTAGEKHQLLVEWNQNIVIFPNNKCIHQLFEEQVEKTPDAVAVIFANEEITYQELNQRANQLANYLQTLGVGADQLVGLCLEPSLARIIGLLAILKAGGVYLPLDAVYPQERLRFMIEDSQVSILLTQESLANKFLINSLQVVNLDADWEKISTASINNLQSCVTGENLAYIIYTSGSTGTPKGVLISHQAIAHHCQNIIAHYQINPSDRILQFASLSFDVSLEQILPTLSVGATLILVDAKSLTPAEFHQKLIDYRLTVIDIPPVYLTQWLQFLDENTVLTPINQLRLVICGGEALPPATLKLWHNSLLTGVRLINAYGPTETTITAITFTVPQDITTIEFDSNIPIGRPLPNRKVYILDSHKNLVPIGVFGELYIGGEGLAQGYLNRPELTNDKFLTNPFDNSTLYKTGDLVRYLPDGNILFLGRIDNQVKIRGFRIELGEIEAFLNQHPNLTAATVITREDIPGDKKLVAYIILKTHQNSLSETSNQLRQFLQQKLPDYMIPAAFVVLESFPVTANGKIDYRAFPAPDFSANQNNYVAAKTPTEEILANIWSQVLKVENIGMNDNFFELGGHSLLATQVTSRIRQKLNQEIPLSLLFAFPTISQLSAQISIQKTTNNNLLPPIEPRQQQENLPLSFAQQRLWFLAQLEPNNTAYNMPLTLQLQGSLNITALERSIREIITRHEILRTNFMSIDGQPTQVINKNFDFKLPVIDLQYLPDEQQKIEAAKIANQDAQTPVNLAQDLLFRVKLLQLNTQSHLLLFNIHHIIFDGWSDDILQREIAELYQIFSTCNTLSLPSLVIQYADFALWQQHWFTGEVLESQLNYWKQKLGGNLPILELPTDRPRPRVKTYSGATKTFVLSSELTANLKSLCQQEEVTLFMTLLTGFKILLCRYSRQEDVIVGTPIAGRNRKEIEGLMGFFVNTLALRTDLGDNPSFRELLSRVRQVCLEAYSNQDVPFEQLVEVLQPERDLSHTPIFQVMFALQNAAMGELQLPNLSVKVVEPLVQTAKFDMTLSMSQRNGELIGEWEYNTDLFDAATIERMIEHFQMLISGILAEPEQSIWELPLLTEKERHELLVDWNQTQTNYPQNKCIHQLFEEQVEKTPDAIAVVFAQQQLTYRELNQRANQLANYLQTLGVKPEVLVGICTERSLEMIVGILGILKAGGAYLPLDIAYPQERLAFMLSDSQVSILLTQQHLVAKLPEHQTRIVCLDTNSKAIELESQENVTNSANSDNLAYVMYTSGSTGQPKGVCVVHRGVVRLVKETNYASFDSKEVFLQLAPLAFDASTFEIWGSLLNGGKLVIFPAPTPTLEDLAGYIRSYQITTLWLTAGLFHLMVEQRLEDLKPLRQLLAGGDVLSVATVQKVVASLENCQLINGYGPTENTTFSCCYQITQRTHCGDSVPIGRPIANTQVYILDHYLQPVPIGVVGEIYVGGAGLARGYLNRPELTEQRFVTHAFTNSPEVRLYKTGDLGRYLVNGEIQFLGRIDNQVKIRGFRIELGEIEALLNQHPNLTAAKVITREDIPGDKRLVVYIILKTHQNSLLETSNQLRQYLQQKLPDYMIPAAFVVLESFPLTPNGKVDIRALPMPEFIHLNPVQDINFLDNLELQLIKIWENILGVRPVGVNDNFFNLGGHSLLAVRLFAQIQKIFGKSISLATLFQSPTIRQLANVLRDEGYSCSWSSLVPIQPHGSKPPFYYIHTASGGLVHIHNLSCKLDADQPVYGLQAQGLDGKTYPHTCIEDMASHYIREIQTVQPHGPYLLSGWCVGGMIAYEMAQQFDAQGETVKLLTIFDAYPPKILPPVNKAVKVVDSKSPMKLKYAPIYQSVLDLMNMIKRNFENFANLTLQQQMNLMREKVNRRVNSKIREIVYQFCVKMNLPVPHALWDLLLKDAIAQAHKNYEPKVYGGKVVFFKAMDHSPEYAVYLEKWQELAAGGLEVHDVPGNHDSILSEPNVSVLAEKLRDYLNS
ncbi:amino acid adenylation domain-containing protein [Sphaerospermopsis aphanizomenoides BCCUSP55]|uniref:non-ribosomal peptide synthetase n=1 Tax=Sphaerospermopsis aphanizomenoides TaxID=459663 RepID=UPI0019072537|nr:non-ribosomal peptide synthetase [Sphaerospermopsis aphanizomenoides]MBK1986127.1 amino acid adenylation domain-containing protein [Sphaerospermopsis aphanizomenoides BCCUSP55]